MLLFLRIARRCGSLGQSFDRLNRCSRALRAVRQNSGELPQSIVPGLKLRIVGSLWGVREALADKLPDAISQAVQLRMRHVPEKVGVACCQSRRAPRLRMHFACGGGWQIVFCGVGINQDLPSPVGKMKAIAVHVDAVADPLVAAVVLRLPFVDLDFVEAARRVAHRTGKHLGAFSLAANVNEAHRYAADRNARSIFENFVLPHHSEPFEKGPECRHESYRQETGWIGVSAHMPLRSGTCYFKRDERCNQVSHPTFPPLRCKLQGWGLRTGFSLCWVF